MTPAQQRAAFDKAARAGARRRTALVRDTRAAVLDILKQAEQDVRLAISQQPEGTESWRLDALQKEVRRAMAEFADAAAPRAAAGQAAAAAAGEAMIEQPLAAIGARVDLAAPRISTRQLEAMRSFLTEKIRDVGTAAADKINTQLGLAIVGARSPFEVTRAVQKILGEDTRQRATVIVRTELARAFGVAAQASLADAAKQIPGLRKAWRRSGKVHSRWNHDLADGQTVAWDQPFVLNDGKTPGQKVELMFPVDPKGPPGETINCGCALLPVLPESEGLVPTTPRKRPFTAQEIALNPRKADLAERVPIRAVRPAPAPVLPPPTPPPQYPAPVFREAKTIKEAEGIGREIIAARGPTQYATAADGAPLRRYRHSPTRGVLTHEQQLAYYGNVSYKGLDLETANALNRWLVEAAQEADRIGVPRLRGVMTSPPRGARASMGDGVLAVSKNLTVKPIAGEALQQNRRAHVARYDAWRAADEPGGNAATRRTRPFSGSTGYFATERESTLSTAWHEFGHHLHQQLGVASPEQYAKPPLEAALIKVYTRETVFPTEYAFTSRFENFAESFSLLRMGKPEKLDPRMLSFIRQVEQGSTNPTVGGA